MRGGVTVAQWAHNPQDGVRLPATQQKNIHGVVAYTVLSKRSRINKNNRMLRTAPIVDIRTLEVGLNPTHANP